ncbi:HipA N-terminal domain-containing protein [Vibrio sp. SCSIO 43136]|uniref:HipA N-terminal domain-containing protein n=1 Tax=Vibrio sp. SCSIO 43136 TaxID=2819101 RepID=UPI0020760DCE|nr:HipA N-terminal domain-containing protein [Vibrio sp. SCSIO 43136]USD65823.1 HipA N-terminal domain-containing protein [Vibrio sp. SCSIO 43136]
MKQLLAYMNGELVGALVKRANGAHSFTYDASWLSNEKARPLSLKLQVPII